MSAKKRYSALPIDQSKVQRHTDAYDAADFNRSERECVHRHYLARQKSAHDKSRKAIGADGTVTVGVRPATKERLRFVTDRDNTSPSALVRQLIEEYLVANDDDYDLRAVTELCAEGVDVNNR